MNQEIIDRLVSAFVAANVQSLDKSQINLIIGKALQNVAYIPIDLEDIYCLGMHLNLAQAQAVLRLAQEQYIREAGINPDVLRYHANQVLAINGEPYEISELQENFEIPKELQLLISEEGWLNAVYQSVFINSTQEKIIVIYSEELQSGIFYDILDNCYRVISCYGHEDLVDKCLNLDGKEI